MNECYCCTSVFDESETEIRRIRHNFAKHNERIKVTKLISWALNQGYTVKLEPEA